MSATRRLEIDAGHRLAKHESKCRNLHGHRYVFDVTCEGVLDEVGRVIDFSDVKRIVGGWLDEHWDHGMILQHGDPMVDAVKTDGSKLFLLDVAPTAENLAAILLDKARELLADRGIRVTKVVCYETPNCWAEAT